MELPVSFIESTRKLLGDEAYAHFAAALQGEQPVSIRLNERYRPIKSSISQCGAVSVPWSSTGYYLSQRPQFTFDPWFHAGCYYVQEASSMFVEQAIKRYVSGERPVVALDLCAAPGGKTTHLLSLLPSDSLLVSNEVIRNRAQILAENVTKWGALGTVVTNNDPADFSSLTHVFDVMVTDVPCSGEGMFRKDPVAVSEWSAENVAICWQRQRRILADVWDSLKPGGLLLYSTCTYNTHENEENVAWICRELGAEVLPVDVLDDWGITGNLLNDEFPVYRFMPHKSQGEGFFLAVMRKHQSDEDEAVDYENSPILAGNAAKSRKGKQVSVTFPKELLACAQRWVKQAEDYQWITTATSVSLFPKSYSGLLSLLQRHLRVLQAGVEVGEIKGKDVVPQHALAMSHVLQSNAFPSVELNYTQAIAYLRKEAVALDAGAPRGFVLVCYHHIPLGFVKNIGNRANNLYPQEWRIRSGYLPDTAVCVLNS